MGYCVHKGDVKNAFLQGKDYEEELFGEPVEELRRALGLTPGQCVKFLKAIYGLPEAPRYWWKRLHQDLEQIGFEDVVAEPCVYTYRNNDNEISALVVAYVDDVMVAFNPEDQMMQNKFVEI